MVLGEDSALGCGIANMFETDDAFGEIHIEGKVPRFLARKVYIATTNFPEMYASLSEHGACANNLCNDKYYVYRYRG